ncbi:MAG: antibiotic biosynthesis monooxygenase [Allomuricauda sp.]
MYAVIYQFKVVKGLEDDFIWAWKQLTKAFVAHSGGLGSRLHKDGTGLYIAYAQWPNKESWQTAKEKLPESAMAYITEMERCCKDKSVLYQMSVENDLLKP